MKESPFLKILDKNSLIKLIRESLSESNNNQIHLTNTNSEKERYISKTVNKIILKVIIITFVYSLIFLYPSKSQAKIISTNGKDTASFNRRYFRIV